MSVCRRLLLCLCWIPIAQASNYAIGPCVDDYHRCLDEWKAERVATLKSEDGYLNLVGLFWLKKERSSFGSGVDNDIVFPEGVPAQLGWFGLDKDGVTMTVSSGADVQLDGGRVQNTRMADDLSGEPGIASFGSLAWMVIRRDNLYAIRLRDFENPALNSFESIDYFPTDESLRIEARLKRYNEPRILRVATVIEGLDYKPSSPGVLQFDIDGRTVQLEAYTAGDELLIVFGDTTSGRETYPAGRFLYAQKPGSDDRVLLDFNTAQNPPCAFNEFATCPIASPRNRLKVRIAAGERYDPSSH